MKPRRPSARNHPWPSLPGESISGSRRINTSQISVGLGSYREFAIKRFDQILMIADGTLTSVGILLGLLKEIIDHSFKCTLNCNSIALVFDYIPVFVNYSNCYW